MKKIPKLKIDIRNATPQEAIIDIDGEIGWVNEEGEWNTTSAIKSKLREISELNTKKIIVNINSLGGFVDDGLAIHDVLASHNAEIETRVIGMTASAATVIAQAGNKRTMSDNALYLIHQAWGMAIGNSTDMLALASDLETIDGRLLNIYVKRSGKSEKEIKALMQENAGGGKWIDASEAKAYGLIDELFEPVKAAAAVSRDMFKNMGLPEPEENKVTFKDDSKDAELAEIEKLRNEADELKREAKELEKESQKQTSNGLRTLLMRKTQNRKQANKLNEVH